MLLKKCLALISDKFCKLLIGLYFQCFLCNEKNYSNVSVFSVFTQTHKNKSIVNLYEIELLGYFSEDIKMWPSHMCWIGETIVQLLLYNIYADSMGLYTNVNSLLFWVYYSSQKISENKTALNCSFGFAIANTIKATNLKQFN